jgi:hypothetical protein
MVVLFIGLSRHLNPLTEGKIRSSLRGKRCMHGFGEANMG